MRDWFVLINIKLTKTCLITYCKLQFESSNMLAYKMGLPVARMKVFVRTFLVMMVVTRQSVNGFRGASFGVLFFVMNIIVIITVGDTSHNQLVCHVVLFSLVSFSDYHWR